MQIDHVHYERRMSDGNYGNRSASMSASVDEGDDINVIFTMLRSVVHVALDVDQRDEERAERETREALLAERERRYQEEREARTSRLADVPMNEGDPF